MKFEVSGLEYLLSRADSRIAAIGKKVVDGQRLSADEGLALYQSSDLGLLGALACFVKHRKSGNWIYFNRKIHIEPTNICIYRCGFCSFSCSAGDKNSWEKTVEAVANEAIRYQQSDITEIHIVGGVHPERDLYYYVTMLQAVRSVLPHVHIKAFSAVELDYMFVKANVSVGEGLDVLKRAGLGSIPGGGAEIFDEEIREKICPEKTGSQRWLSIHRAAHHTGISSNATMLYGHIEQYRHRIDHLMRLRCLQDETNGFKAFIPLKFRAANTKMSHIDELTAIEDMKNYAVCRIFLDNIPYLKTYLPMIGKDMAQMALSFGADNMDAAIENTTKIYPVAPNITTIEEIKKMISAAGYQPIERDSMYNRLNL